MDASARQSLQKNAELKTRVARFFQSPTATNRQAIVQSFQPALTIKGDRQRGAAFFGKLCVVCHTVEGQGSQVGPSLSGISTRPSETVLIDIVDPSREVSPDFITYAATTTKDETLTGLISAETATSVTIRRQGLPDETVLRNQIKDLRAEAKSLMPEGLEQGLTEQDMADLLAFLREPDPGLLPK